MDDCARAFLTGAILPTYLHLAGERRLAEEVAMASRPDAGKQVTEALDKLSTLFGVPADQLGFEPKTILRDVLVAAHKHLSERHQDQMLRDPGLPAGLVDAAYMVAMRCIDDLRGIMGVGVSDGDEIHTLSEYVIEAAIIKMIAPTVRMLAKLLPGDQLTYARQCEIRDVIYNEAFPNLTQGVEEEWPDFQKKYAELHATKPA